MTFMSFAKPIKKLVTTIVASDELHANGLIPSLILKTAAPRKIAACEHPTLVKEGDAQTCRRGISPCSSFKTPD